MVGAAVGLAGHHRVDHLQHLALGIDAQHIGAELVADPPLVAHHLDRLGVEVRAGEVALGGVLVLDEEGHLAVRVAQEGGLQPADLAAVPVGTDLVHHQQGILRIELVTEAVVGEGQEFTLAQRHDARETLHRLPLDGQAAARQARVLGVTHKSHARDGAQCFDALAVAAGEFAGRGEQRAGIGGRSDRGAGRQAGMAGKGGAHFGLCMGCAHGEQGGAGEGEC